MQRSLNGAVRRSALRLAAVTAVAGLTAAMTGTAGAAQAPAPAAPGAAARTTTAGLPQGSMTPLATSTSKVVALPLNALDSKGNWCGWNPSTQSGGGFGKGSCFGGYSWVNGAVAGSVNSDHTEDVFLRSAASGHLYGLVSGVSKPIDQGAGWNSFTALAMPGNLGGTAADDMLARDSKGVLWVFPGNSNGHLGKRIKVGSGWNTYRAIFGKYDYNGDGRTDLLGIDYKNSIWLHPGTGSISRPFGSRVRIATNFSGYNYVLSTGDVNRDGRSDFLARDKNGVLWLFRGYDRKSHPFATRVSLGSALKSFKRIF